MATYAELFTLHTDTALRNRIVVAMTIAAQKVIDGDITEAAPTTAAQLKTWAARALAAPKQEAEQVFIYVLAKNVGVTTSQIQSATDASIQSNVEAAINALASTL